jgi:hypothetical protein
LPHSAAVVHGVNLMRMCGRVCTCVTAIGGGLAGADMEDGEFGAQKPKAGAGKAKSGGFQSMGLSANILGGIMKMGYKVPTPIQRRALPVALSGRDVVAMARTGECGRPSPRAVQPMRAQARSGRAFEPPRLLLLVGSTP